MAGLVGVLPLCATLAAEAGPSWLVRVEEPTGLYPRTNEVVAVPYSKIGGRHPAWQVLDPHGREVAWQAAEDALLFPATLIPGELPEYRLRALSQANTNFVNPIHLRTLGLNRLELGNSFFRILIEKQAAAITETFNLTAEKYRTVNLVETTPEDPEALKDDIHAAEAMGFKPVPGVPAGNSGWTSLNDAGPITEVTILESGPLRGRVRLARTNETWDLAWTAQSRALIWRLEDKEGTAGPNGFRFTAISASPYLPFDRCVSGSEYEWPSGPDDSEPPDHEIAPRAWKSLPGGHAVYYRNGENYGALGIVTLDTNLLWTGIGSRRFIAENPTAHSTRIALTFPEWAGSNTVLQARQEYRMLTQPLLIDVEKAGDSRKPGTAEEGSAGQPNQATNSAAAPPGLPATFQEAAQTPPTERPSPFYPDSLPLDGDWELVWCEKGAGPPTNGWRTVKVPGSAHTQWLTPSNIYSPEATWVSYKEWWYRRSFRVPGTFAGKRLRLQFGATDYYADTWLNGVRLGRHEGYIDPYEYRRHLDRSTRSNQPTRCPDLDAGGLLLEAPPLYREGRVWRGGSEAGRHHPSGHHAAGAFGGVW